MNKDKDVAGMYCIKCGVEGKVYENLCKECFLKDITSFSIPDIIKISICPHCSARAKGNHWEDSVNDDDAINKSVTNKIYSDKRLKNVNYLINLEIFKTNILNVSIYATGEYGELNIIADLKTEVRINYKTCPRCSRMSGNYYEAIIQVRATNRKITENELAQCEKIVKDHLNSISDSEPNAFLTKSEIIHGGVDYYIGSSNAARQVSRILQGQFNGVVKESSSLIGRKEGRDVYRTTLLIRIPEYMIEDFIKLGEKIYQIQKIYSRTVTCIDLESGQKIKLSRQDVDNSQHLDRSNAIFDAVVIFESENEVQILDPENYKTVEIVKPKNFKVAGDTIKIFKYQDYLYLIPNLDRT